ncbi:MAG: hypothetical protein IPN95_21155 [Bacteroidetes bacterium]|nr:hypothetical protein [Bacteroidota bacterium]MBP6722033.1 hypothetical protein [Bacteroidia bacterium]
MKLKLKLNSHYDDKLVKGNFWDEVKANVKPGDSKGPIHRPKLQNEQRVARGAQ